MFWHGQHSPFATVASNLAHGCCSNPSGLNHVCMILVALFSFQRTPRSSFLSVALLLLVKFLDVPFMYAFVALLRRASLRPKITSRPNLHESILSCLATKSLRKLLFSGNINQYPNAFPEAFASWVSFYIISLSCFYVKHFLILFFVVLIKL